MIAKTTRALQQSMEAYLSATLTQLQAAGGDANGEAVRRLQLRGMRRVARTFTFPGPKPSFFRRRKDPPQTSSKNG